MCWIEKSGQLNSRRFRTECFIQKHKHSMMSRACPQRESSRLKTKLHVASNWFDFEIAQYHDIVRCLSVQHSVRTKQYRDCCCFDRCSLEGGHELHNWSCHNYCRHSTAQPTALKSIVLCNKPVGVFSSWTEVSSRKLNVWKSNL